MIMKQMKENKIWHSCKRGEPNHSSARFYSIDELFDHVLNDCPKRENICPNCGMEFETLEESFQHIKKDCNYVMIDCDYCNKSMMRGEFRKHKCYEYAN